MRGVEGEGARGEVEGEGEGGLMWSQEELRERSSSSAVGTSRM